MPRSIIHIDIIPIVDQQRGDNLSQARPHAASSVEDGSNIWRANGGNYCGALPDSRDATFWLSLLLIEASMSCIGPSPMVSFGGRGPLTGPRLGCFNPVPRNLNHCINTRDSFFHCDNLTWPIYLVDASRHYLGLCYNERTTTPGSSPRPEPCVLWALSDLFVLLRPPA